MFRSNRSCALLDSALRTSGSWFAVSEAGLLVESQLFGTVSPQGLFGVASSFSTALRVPSGFSDRRFETAPELSFSKHIKQVLAKW